MTRVGGIILCGGRSSRMGTPKAWLPVGGEPLLARVARVVAGAVHPGPVVVVAAPGQDVPPLPPEFEIVRDEVEDRGPLGGLAAGLDALAGRADAAYLSACDVPFLTAAFVRRVAAGLDGTSAAVPFADGRPHPLAAAYPLAVLPVVRSQLAAGRLRLTDLFALVPTRFLAADHFADTDPGLRSVVNVNTPAEYERARGDVG